MVKALGDKFVEFLSPVRELHFSMEPQGLLAQLVEQFPSPIGELHFSIMCCDYSINYQTRFRPLSGNYISQYHPYNPATSLGSWSGLRGKNIFGKINKIHSLKSAANSVFKPCAAKSKQIFSFIKKYQFHIVPYIKLKSGYITYFPSRLNDVGVLKLNSKYLEHLFS